MEIAGFDRIKERQTIYFDENASLKEVYKSTLSILDSRHGGQIAIDFMKHNLQLMSDYLPLFLEYQGRVIAEHQKEGTALYDKPSPELIDKLVKNPIVSQTTFYNIRARPASIAGGTKRPHSEMTPDQGENVPVSSTSGKFLKTGPEIIQSLKEKDDKKLAEAVERDKKVAEREVAQVKRARVVEEREIALQEQLATEAPLVAKLRELQKEAPEEGKLLRKEHLCLLADGLGLVGVKGKKRVDLFEVIRLHIANLP